MTKRFWQCAAWLSVITIFVLCTIPSPQLVSVSYADKIQHFVAFAAVSFLFRLAYPQNPGKAYFAAFILGGAVELVQAMIPWRSAEWLDLLADSMGIVLCMLVVELTPIKKYIRRSDR